MAQNPQPKDPGIQLFFRVSIDKDHDLGLFTACDGLTCEVVVEAREEGGNNEFVHQLPVRLKYTNVKLTRPLDQSSKAVSDWFSSMSGTIKRATAEVTALTSDNEPIATWHLTGVIPVRWQGPSFSTESAKLATETLELAHHGFKFEMAP
jgi:phage tail-like protein